MAQKDFELFCFVQVSDFAFQTAFAQSCGTFVLVLGSVLGLRHSFAEADFSSALDFSETFVPSRGE